MLYTMYLESFTSLGMKSPNRFSNWSTDRFLVARILRDKKPILSIISEFYTIELIIYDLTAIFHNLDKIRELHVPLGFKA